MRSPTLRSLLAVTAVALVSLAVLVVGVRAVSLLGRFADDQAIARVRLAGKAARESVDRSGSGLEMAAKLLSERPTLQRVLAARDTAALIRFLDRFGSTGGLTGCAVMASGAVVAASGDTTLPWPAIEAQGLASGGRWIVVARPPPRPPLLAAVVPIGGLPASAAAVALSLDESYAADAALRAGVPVAIISRQAVLDDTGASAIAAARGRAIDQGSAQAARLDEEGAFVSVDPVRTPSGEVAAIVETRLDTAGVDASAARLVRALALTTLFVAGLVAIAAVLIARRIVGPLEALTAASDRIGRGDLDTPIPRAEGAEMGVLATTMEDMRDRLLRLTADLRRRSAEADAVLGGIVEGVFAVDRERRITYLNPQAAAMIGLSREEAIGRFCGDALNPDPVEGARPCEDRCPILDARFRGGARAAERLVLADGRRRMVEITSAAPPPEEPDGTLRQVQVMRDETEEDAARRLRDTVLANISHEFRTPLSAQLASIEILRDRLKDVPGGDVDDLTRTIERAALRLTRLIDNLLESLRIEAGRDTIRRQPVAIDQVVEEAVGLTSSLIQQKAQRLEIDLPYPLPELTGDAPRLAQAFVNILANANKFAPAGSCITMGGAVSDGEVALWVEDEGPGFPEDVGEHLFERFRRAPGEEPEESGMGLGLWIVNSIITRHGGRVDARNTGRGARVTVTLPRAKPDEDPGR